MSSWFVACSNSHPTQQPHTGLAAGCHALLPGTDTGHRDAEMWERLAEELLLLTWQGRSASVQEKGGFLATMWGLCSVVGAFLGGPHDGEGGRKAQEPHAAWEIRRCLMLWFSTTNPCQC